MTRKRMRIFIASLAVILLVGCASLEEQATDGLESAKIVFQGEAETPNKEVNKIKLFLPSGFQIEDGSDESNIILSKGKASFILFMNPNETQESKLYYELMMANSNANIIEEQVFEFENRFGFAAVLQNGEESYELVTSIGGIKLTTISSEKEIANKLEQMMTILRSIQTNKEE